MKIAHLLPASVRFPLSKHNGRYEWALRLARLQAADGHEVSFYAGPSSSDESPIIWRSIEDQSSDKRANNLELIKTALRDNHDIYHSHFDYLHYLAAKDSEKPIVFTQHWFPNQEIADAAKLDPSADITAVPATNLMAEADDKLGIKHSGIIRQGIDLTRFRPPPGPPGDRLIFVGRIAPWKGVLEAVQIAKSSGVGLDIIGKLNQTESEYWAKAAPYVDGVQIKYLGPKSQAEIVDLFGRARAFIFPSQAPEAAPQTPIEAQACGTPVIMSRVGATNEWLEPGKTGFLANSIEEFADAISKASSLDRSDCRAFAEKFDINKLVKNYYELYEILISG